MAVREPQSATDYDDRTGNAVWSVLLEIAQLLGSFRGKFATVGGAVPWILLDQPEMRHIGTTDVDLALSPSALDDGEYAQLIEVLQRNHYRQRPDLRAFQLARTVPATDEGPDIDVLVDFLMPRDAEITKNSPPLVPHFAVQRADGVDLAIQLAEMVTLEGDMPDGGRNRVRLAIASIPSLLAMKGYAINNRLKHKDAYDIYYSVRNFPGGIGPLTEATRPLLEIPSARRAYGHISDKFGSIEDFGPTSVRKFLEGSRALGALTPAQWQQDAFGQVDAWLRRLRLR